MVKISLLLLFVATQALASPVAPDTAAASTTNSAGGGPISTERSAVAEIKSDSSCPQKLRPWEKWSRLQDAIHTNDRGELERLLKCGAGKNVNTRGPSGKAALHEAIVQKVPAAVELVKILLDNGADPRLPTIDDLKAPIHLAAEDAVYPIPIINLLLAKGADVNARTKKGRTAEEIARKEHRIAVARFLANSASSPASSVAPQDFCLFCVVVKPKSATTADSSTPDDVANYACPTSGMPDALLRDAVKEGNVQEVQNLVWRCGYDVNRRGPNDGDNGLHAAAKSGNANLTLLFLEAGARPNKHNRAGMTPLHLAIQSEEPIPVIETLLERGADINAEFDGLGYPKMNPRQFASSLNKPEVVTFFDDQLERFMAANRDCLFGKIKSMSSHEVADLVKDAAKKSAEGFEHELFEELEDLLEKCGMKDSAMRQFWVPMADHFFEVHGSEFPTDIQARYNSS